MACSISAWSRRRLEQTRREEAYLRHQYEQLEEAHLVDGEQEELERERDLLSNMADIKTQLNLVLSALSEGEVNADSLLKEWSPRRKAEALQGQCHRANPANKWTNTREVHQWN